MYNETSDLVSTPVRRSQRYWRFQKNFRKYHAVLFERDKLMNSHHLKNVFKDEELGCDSVVAKNATTVADSAHRRVLPKAEKNLDTADDAHACRKGMN